MHEKSSKDSKDHSHISEVLDPQDIIVVTTIGLVIHSIADGLALGASMFCNFLVFLVMIVSNQTNEAKGLGILVFFAVLIHKAPAALGFGTFLYHEGQRGWGVAKYVVNYF